MAGKRREVQILDPMPRKVCIVALGASALEYMQSMVGQELQAEFDQVWTLNMGLRIFRHDVLWVMDDLRLQAKNYPAYGRLLAQHDRPIITSTSYPEFPMSVRFPIEQVTEALGDDYFTNTVCYAVALAMVGGVKELTLYGADFWYPKSDAREEGGMNCAYFLGLARHFGMTFHIPQASTLLSSYLARQGKDGNLHRMLYGYAKQPLFATGGLPDGPRPAVTRSTGPQVRAHTGHILGEAEGSESVPTAQSPGPSAALRAAGQGISRKRTRNTEGGTPRMVLAGHRESDPPGADGSGVGVFVCPACKEKGDFDTEGRFAHTDRAAATRCEEKRKMEVRPM